MSGKNHVVLGITSAVANVSVFGIISQYDDSVLHNVSINVLNYLIPSYVTKWSLILWCFLILICVAFGSLLPDIDSKNSILGRYFHLPFKHRTWTHTIWVVLLLCYLARKYLFFGCIFYGYFMHLVIDTFSFAGVCWFYPFEQYREYPSGAIVKKNHKCKLYKGGKTSEGSCFVVCFMLLCFVSVYFGIIHNGFESIFYLLYV